jgi:hypothetical protein
MTNFRTRMRVNELDIFRPMINNRAINEQFSPMEHGSFSRSWEVILNRTVQILSGFTVNEYKFSHCIFQFDDWIYLLTVTRRKPTKQITTVLKKNCSKDIKVNTLSTFSDKLIILWCLAIRFFMIVIRNCSSLWLFKISVNLSQSISIWLATWST